MQKIIRLFKKFWPILLLIILTFLLRIIKLEELFYFTYDESIPAFVGRRLILWGHIPLIGGVTPFNFHLAPYFYWFYSAVLFFGKLNPLAWGWAMATIAIATTLMMYNAGKTFASRKVGFLAASFWTFSYLANVYDRHLWALYWGPLVSLMVIISLYKIIKGNDKFVFLLAGTLAFAIHADPSNLVFLALSAIVWVIYKIPVKNNTLLAFLIVVLSFLPLVIFDLRHDFANTRPVIDFWKQGRNTPGFHPDKFVNNSLLFPQAFSRLLYTFGDNQIAKQYSYCQTFVHEKFQAIPWYVVLASTVAILGFLLWTFSKNRKNQEWRIVSILLILFFLGIQIYGTIFRADIFEHYITGTFAVFLLIFAKVVSLLPKKLWLFVMAIFIFVNLNKLSTAKNSHGLVYKRQAIEFVMQNVGDKEFSLESHSTCWRLSGYRYLFTVFGREPVKSYVDPNLGYLYGTTPIASKHPDTVVAIVTHDFTEETDEFYRRYAVLKSHELKNGLFGNIEVIIMDNSSAWFDKNI